MNDRIKTSYQHWLRVTDQSTAAAILTLAELLSDRPPADEGQEVVTRSAADGRNAQ